MDAPTGPHLSRELSPRQREVAALISEGKTNGEIATELCISLQGAKCHVSELLRALDLDTREEVAEWWRQQRGMRARFAVTARWSRMPALVKWGLGGAAAAGVAVVAVFALLLATGSDDGDGGLSPGVWVAVARPDVVERALPDGQTGLAQGLLRISVMRHDGSQLRAIGAPADWAQVAFSPDGQWLYALGFDDDGLMSVVLFGLAGQADIRHQIEFENSPIGIPRWSPDSTRVAVAGSGELSILGTDGSAGRWESDSAWSPPTWSADSKSLAIVSQIGLSLHSRDGSVESEFELDGTWLEAIPVDPEVADSRYIGGVEWDGADRLHAFVTTIGDGDGEIWRIAGTRDGTSVSWDPPEVIEWDEHPYWRQTQEFDRVREQFPDAARVDTCRSCPLEVQQGVTVTYAPPDLEPRYWRESDEVRINLYVNVDGEWAQVPIEIDQRTIVPPIIQVVWDVLTIR
jgi:DNA-binding CsgD family transcriptional regulator